MACIEPWSKTLYHTEKQGFGPWLSKNSRDSQQNPLKLSPVSERSAYPLQNYIWFSPLTSGLESFGTNLLLLTGPGLRPTVQNSTWYKNGRGLECRKVNYLQCLGQGTLGCHSLSTQPACSSGSSAAPQTFTLTLASYSHRTSTSLHSICFINSNFKSKRISSKYHVATSKY